MEFYILKKVKDSSNCTLCKLIMAEVKTMMANKKSEVCNEKLLSGLNLTLI
jgi:hypothetical protein